MDKFEKLVLTIMKEADEDGEPVTREEAEEMAKAELNDKENRRYEQSAEKKERKPRERKVDTEKKAILTALSETLRELGFEPTMENEVALHFNEFSLKLTKHRPPKN